MELIEPIHPGSGHNRPPDTVHDLDAEAELRAEVENLATEATTWEAATVDGTNKGALSDFIQDAKALGKRIDDQRKTDKKPFADAGKAVDRTYNALSDALDEMVRPLEKKIGAWLIEEQRRRDEERRQADEAAAKAEAEKRRIEEQAAAGNQDAQGMMNDAERKQTAAQDHAKSLAGKGLASAKGEARAIGLKSWREVEVVDAAAAAEFLKAEPELLEALKKLGERRLRAFGKDVPLGSIDLPGFRVVERQGLRKGAAR